MTALRPWFRPLLLSLVLLWHGQLLAGHVDHAITDVPVGSECMACAFASVAGAALLQSAAAEPATPGPAAAEAGHLSATIRRTPRSHHARAPPV